METNQATPRLAHSWATRLRSPVTGFVLTRFVGSVSFPSFLPATRYTRPRPPSAGSLGSHFPTFIGTTLGYDYQMFFSMPCAPARSPIPCLFLPFVSSLQARYHSGTLVLTPGLLGLPVRLFRVAYKETSGSPKFPGYPLDLMPCSSTPTGPAGPGHFGPADVAFRSRYGVGSRDDKILSGLNHTAYPLAVYASQPGLPRGHARLASGRRARALPGRDSYPHGPFVQFQRCFMSSYPPHPGFAWRPGIYFRGAIAAHHKSCVNLNFHPSRASFLLSLNTINKDDFIKIDKEIMNVKNIEYIPDKNGVKKINVIRNCFGT